jgi:short-chain Z-isoprenyl diphosphate synthase
MLEGAPLPAHVAMILDGNRRWAKGAGLASPAHGHRAGADKIREFAGWCDDLGIRMVTLYLLSTDNLSGRTTDELEALFGIIGDLATELSQVRDWRVQHVGSSAGLPEHLVSALRAAPARPACTSTSRSATAAAPRSRTRCAASSPSTRPRGAAWRTCPIC